MASTDDPVSIVSADNQRQSLMIRACLLMIAGGYAAQLSSLPLSWDLYKLLFVASIALLFHRRTRCPGYVLFGFMVFLHAGQAIVDERLDKQFAGDSLLTDVRIVDFPKVSASSVTMLVTPLDDSRLPARSRVSWFEPATIPSIGDVWRFELRLKRPRGLSNPGVFDAEAWLFRQKIHATGYVVSGQRNRRLEQGTEGAIDRYRRQFIARAGLAAESSDVAAVLAAVGVGARHQVSREQWHKYAISGTSHLMAISGLHVGLAASVAFLLARVLLGVLRVRANAHNAAIAFGVLVALAYTTVAGFGIPAQRASLMLLVAAAAIVRRRQVDPFSTVAVAALVVFMLDPVATMTPGFLLSFSAVVLLLWLARSRRKRVEAGCLIARAGDQLRQLAKLQVFLLFGLLPLTVILFQRVALLALPVNLIAVPLFSLVTVPLTLTGLAIGNAAENASQAVLQIAALSVEWLLALIDALVRLPFADTTVAGVQKWRWMIVVLPCLWAFLPKGWPGRSVSLLAVGALLLPSPERPGDGCFDAHVLDVGQGLATVVETRHSTLVFDTGASFRSGGSVANQVLLPFLRSRGIQRIDWLVVSHADIDHSGGVRAIQEYAEIGRTLLGEALPGTDIAASACVAGQSWQADEVGFRILHPASTAPREGNNASCVLLLETGRHRLLLTGDIESGAERDIIAAHRALIADIDVVVVPHHGSLTSSSAPFVDTVSPLVAIVSAGFNNRWGFPKPRVVARWQAVGAEVLDTATSGAVSFRLCAAGGLGPTRKDRLERRRFWREHAA
ncbi:MAG: DNA internalization-related competence protein ComEC/Rec2 [Woeseiaceae bacterium]|nr:DNA internalization-related competence protein ComEC/Rec2 [Woeseiaceae bacterium]